MSVDDNKQTFNCAMMIYQACSMLGWGENPKEIVDKVNQLRRGLPKEDEFIALSVWMGKCTLIHKLDQKQFPGLSRERYQAPDVFALYDFNGKNVPVLVEVKATSDIKLRPFSSTYYQKLVNYASMLGLPLLVAWRIEKLNLWCLFDLERMTRRRTAFHIDFQTAMNNSLLGILLDDVIININRGTQVFIKFKKVLGTELRSEIDGKLQKFEGIVEDIAWLSPKGEKISMHSTLAKFVDYAFRLIGNDVTEIEDERYVTLTFYTTENENIFAHQLLGPMLAGFRTVPDTEFSWLDAIEGKKFSMDYQHVRSAASEGVRNGVVRMIIRQNPAILPKFLQ